MPEKRPIPANLIDLAAPPPAGRRLLDLGEESLSVPLLAAVGRTHEDTSLPKITSDSRFVEAKLGSNLCDSIFAGVHFDSLLKVRLE